MTGHRRTLIVGLGSEFGDDRLGFVAAERLAALLPECEVRRLRSPVGLLDDAADFARLHVIDACRGAGPAGTIVRRDWPADDLQPVRFRGTHDFGLISTFQLAERLHRLPSRATIWVVESSGAATAIDFAAPLSPPVAAAVEALVSRVVAEETPCHA